MLQICAVIWSHKCNFWIVLLWISCHKSMMKLLGVSCTLGRLLWPTEKIPQLRYNCQWERQINSGADKQTTTQATQMQGLTSQQSALFLVGDEGCMADTNAGRDLKRLVWLWSSGRWKAFEVMFVDFWRFQVNILLEFERSHFLSCWKSARSPDSICVFVRERSSSCGSVGGGECFLWTGARRTRR